MTRAVFFDADGVLVHGYHARPERRIRWDENLLNDLGVDPERFRTEFIFDIFIKKVIIGQMPLVEALDRVLPSLGYKGSAMNFVSYWLSHDSNVNQPLLDTIRRLRQANDSRLYIATNQDHVRAQWLWLTLGFRDHFDDIFYSARLGVLKPNPTYFEAIASRIGRQDQPPLFFDDSEEVVAGARCAGWDAVLYDDHEDCISHPWIAERLASIPES
ncbi:MAG: HAD-IA family hydrolase [Hyphomicrobium sp.]|nr:HAD-IA family hydrolase [Hyphomicrobium sp.]